MGNFRKNGTTSHTLKSVFGKITNSCLNIYILQEDGGIGKRTDVQSYNVQNE